MKPLCHRANLSVSPWALTLEQGFVLWSDVYATACIHSGLSHTAESAALGLYEIRASCPLQEDPHQTLAHMSCCFKAAAAETHQGYKGLFETMVM